VGYLALVAVAGVLTGSGLPLGAKAHLPAIYATMHGSWGAGFLTSLRRSRRHDRQ
jgi:succinoglycan biosynthesis protein ExoA